ncbi:hypothetical protein CP532_1823 [Ophiocordyceps camponoti-leonardi (nom. inval.)]|nr:hypothetical protein CP532_1823 [Ophiocordyceps camponoti-leonardi (nom. inval.)]
MTLLGEEISDPEEETFLLYAQQPLSTLDLGFVDPRAGSVTVTVGGREVVLSQSPALLASDREGGTTGAVTPLLATWFSTSSHAATLLSALNEPKNVLELGCGISPLTGLAFRPRASTYVFSDQGYVQRLLKRNMASAGLVEDQEEDQDHREHQHKKQNRVGKRHFQKDRSSSSFSFRPLDWDADVVTPSFCHPAPSFDLVIASDCIFNEALVPNFTRTCVDVCRFKVGEDKNDPSSSSSSSSSCCCACVVAQQLRSHDVFRAWINLFVERFRLWRVPAEMLPVELRPESGFVIHVAVLRDP